MLLFPSVLRLLPDLRRLAALEVTTTTTTISSSSKAVMPLQQAHLLDTVAQAGLLPFREAVLTGETGTCPHLVLLRLGIETISLLVSKISYTNKAHAQLPSSSRSSPSPT